MLVQLGRGALLRTYHELGLRRTEGPPCDARLSSQGTDTFQTPYPNLTAGSTVPPRQVQLRSQNATHSGRRHIPPPRQGRQEIYQRGLRDIFILRSRHRRRHPSSTQRTRFATGATNGKHNDTMQIVPGLHGIPRRGRPHLQSERHGTRHPQRRIVFIQTQGLQPRRGTHVHVSKRRHTHK